MEYSKRVTIHFDASIYRALQFKASATDRSISETVNDAVRAAFAVDVADLAALEKRRRERGISFESTFRDLRKRGRI